jgi:transcriptional regulator with XRE-family HTH domain
MAEPAVALKADATLGDLLRFWRRVRSMSQLDLASAAMTTPRHMSFVETGRSKPSREMVLRLASALDVPLRDRNGLLLAAGFAPLYAERALDDPALDRVHGAISRMLAQHEPLPAVVMDRGWTCSASTPARSGCSPACSPPSPCRPPPTCCA